MGFSILVGMADIASRSGYATYIRLLNQCYTRSEKSIASPVMSRRHLHHMDHPLDVRCHPLQYVCSPFEVEGEGEGEGDRRGRGRDGGRGHGPDGESGRGTPEPILPTSIPPHTYPSPSIPPHTYTSPPIPPHTYTSPSIPPHTYTSPSIPLDTYTSLPYPVSPEPASIAVDITF